MAMWVWAQILVAATAGIGGTVGATAPTGARLGTLVKAVTDLAPVGTSRQHIPNEWGTLKVDDNDLHVGTGRHWIQFRSTKKQSGELGSPIQGWNWGLGAAIDECQDSLAAYEDIVARLRAGKDAPIMATATAKDSPAWRNWRDSLSKNWKIHRLLYSDTPFVHDSHWEMMKEECSEREWRRRGLAEDVGPEKMTYLTWLRDRNLRTVPAGAEDITQDVLAPWGGNFNILIGHDPGQICDVSVLLKAYRLPGERGYCWFIVDEVTTRRTTTEEHGAELLVRLRTKWRANLLNRYGKPSNGPQALVRADPYSDSGNDNRQPDKSVYTILRTLGLKVLPAAYSKTSIKKVKPGPVPKDAGIKMVVRLLYNASGITRLCVAKNDNAPCATNVVRAFEMSERNAEGIAETDKKDESDLSHWMAAIRYALWSIEKPRIGVAA